MMDFAPFDGARHDLRTRIATDIGGKKFTINPPPRRRFENGDECGHEIAKQFNVSYRKPPGASVAHDIALTIRFEKTEVPSRNA